MTDKLIFREMLKENKVVAIVGFSDNNMRPSNRIGRYLDGNMFKVYGVNPKLHNKVIDQISCFASLKDVPEHIDIVNVFRRSEFLLDVVKESSELDLLPGAIWAQVGVISLEAKELAHQKGISYVENKCIMVEHSNI
ncbi:MAG: CoA-binding protein [Bacteroidetes bacterium]|nr:CoA-binding protein [Bacteroidota bacterium]